MYNKKILRFSQELFALQKKKKINCLLGLYEEALKKINTLAIQKIVQGYSLYKLNTNVSAEAYSYGQTRYIKCTLLMFFALIFLIIFHVTLWIITAFIKKRECLPTGNITLYGEHSYVTGQAYTYLGKLMQNSQTFSIIGVSELFNQKLLRNSFAFIGLAPTCHAFIKNIQFIFRYSGPLLTLKAIKVASIRDQLLFLFEYIKAIYAIQKSQQFILSAFPQQVNIFMCDNNFFFTVHIDALNYLGYNTTVLQHGSSLEGNFFYFPAISNHVLSCSKREELLFKATAPNLFVQPLGLPLQIAIGMEDKLQAISEARKSVFDILILGRNGALWEIELAYKVFNNMSSNYLGGNILIRHHPASTSKMKKMLETPFPNFVLSHNRMLEEDIADSNIIISFSIDANILCMFAKKKVIFCGEPEAGNIKEFGRVFDNLKVASTGKELKDMLQYFLNNPVVFKDDYKHRLNNFFGEHSLEKIKNNYLQYIQKNKIS